MCNEYPSDLFNDQRKTNSGRVVVVVVLRRRVFHRPLTFSSVPSPDLPPEREHPRPGKAQLLFYHRHLEKRVLRALVPHSSSAYARLRVLANFALPHLVRPLSRTAGNLFNCIVPPRSGVHASRAGDLPPAITPGDRKVVRRYSRVVSYLFFVLFFSSYSSPSGGESSSVTGLLLLLLFFFPPPAPHLVLLVLQRVFHFLVRGRTPAP